MSSPPGHLLLDRQAQTPARRIELFVLYLLALRVGANGIATAIYHSNRIEGNRLSLPEVRAIVEALLRNRCAYGLGFINSLTVHLH